MGEEVIMPFDRQRLAQLVDQLFQITAELSEMTGRPFTPDGHLVGSLGEVIAANAYGLLLEPPSTRGFDASKDGRRIEIKATFGNRVAFRRQEADDAFHHCLVLKLSPDSRFKEVFNGPAQRILDAIALRRLPSNGQIQVSLAQLKMLNMEVIASDRLALCEQTLGEEN